MKNYHQPKFWRFRVAPSLDPFQRIYWTPTVGNDPMVIQATFPAVGLALRHPIGSQIWLLKEQPLFSSDGTHQKMSGLWNFSRRTNTNIHTSTVNLC